MTVTQFIYTSASSSKDFGTEQLHEILEVSRKNNVERGVTGILLFVEGSFFQVLEGERGEVERLYEKISKDKRHRHMALVLAHDLPSRVFGDWSMGYAELTKEDLEGLDGLCDVFSKEAPSLEPSRVGSLIQAFKEGRWRSKVR